MKKIFSGKTIFSLGMIFGAVLMLIMTFAVPGLRTYIGRDKGKDMEPDLEMHVPMDIRNEGTIELERQVYDKDIPIEKRMARSRDVKLAEDISSEEVIPQDMPQEKTVPSSREPIDTVPIEETAATSSKEEVEAQAVNTQEPKLEVITNDDIVKYYNEHKEYFQNKN